MAVVYPPMSAIPVPVTEELLQALVQPVAAAAAAVSAAAALVAAAT
eukprot:CAMPEP_0177232750 /NCGR_PEP_ID=MMETSP0367-20130122/43492_1 /TAXON_ID=447022 ORGANISM="Scrippsiella hangoei-like, Strain SHHI-4" /NCGR_SAMPLE_ID=MMETSP0367 /ASSEMBLY_ACC=CAM_ASM_000362 /LENGTH=45 /DNA_ID= /DNA_START= /DNA_END= /DNA_ORIENTATION=